MKEDSPKETAEFKKLSPAEKQAVKDVYGMINNIKGDDLISKIDGIVKQAAKKNKVKVSNIEDYFDNEILN